MPYYRRGRHPPEAPHPAPRARRRALLRGADGGGGVLLRLLPAVPPGHAVGDRRRRPVGAARPGTDAEPATAAAAPQAARALPGRGLEGARRGHRAAAGAGQRRRADLLRRRGRRSPLYRNAIGDECVYVESGTATVETVFGALEVAPGRLRRSSRGPPPTAGCRRRRAVRLYAIEANSHIAPPKRYLSRFGQFLEHAPYCERDLRGPRSRCVVEGSDVEVYVKHRGPGPAASRAPSTSLPDPPVRRRRLGRLPLPVRVQHRRLRADHRQGAPAAAGPPGLRGPQLRDLQLRAPQGRLPPAVRSRCRTTTPTSTPTR